NGSSLACPHEWRGVYGSRTQEADSSIETRPASSLPIRTSPKGQALHGDRRVQEEDCKSARGPCGTQRRAQAVLIKFMEQDLNKQPKRLLSVEFQTEVDVPSGRPERRMFLKMYFDARESGLLADIGDRRWRTLCA